MGQRGPLGAAGRAACHYLIRRWPHERPGRLVGNRAVDGRADSGRTAEQEVAENREEEEDSRDRVGVPDQQLPAMPGVLAVMFVRQPPHWGEDEQGKAAECGEPSPARPGRAGQPGQGGQCPQPVVGPGDRRDEQSGDAAHRPAEQGLMAASGRCRQSDTGGRGAQRHEPKPGLIVYGMTGEPGRDPGQRLVARVRHPTDVGRVECQPGPETRRVSGCGQGRERGAGTEGEGGPARVPASSRAEEVGNEDQWGELHRPGDTDQYARGQWPGSAAQVDNDQ